MDACTICGDGGNLLICDGCEKEYHLTCLRPMLASVPDGDWECDECTDRRFLYVRDYILRHTDLFLVEASRKRQREDTGQTSIDRDVDIGQLSLVEAVKEAAQKFAKTVSAALSKQLRQSEAAASTEVAPKESTPMEIDAPVESSSVKKEEAEA